MAKEGFIEIRDKEKYLKEHYPFRDRPGLNDRRRCIHCDRTFRVGEYKVYRDRSGREFIVCPYSPDCDGSMIDWIPV